MKEEWFVGGKSGASDGGTGRKAKWGCDKFIVQKEYTNIRYYFITVLHGYFIHNDFK